MPLTIVFADPDLRVRTALARRLRLDDRIDGRFCDSILGVEEHLDDADVVVTEICLLDGTGFDLLEEVRWRRPEVIRMMLTSALTPDVAAAAGRVGHQWIAKPVSSEELDATLHRIDAVRRRLSSPTARMIAGAVADLPALSDTVTAVMAMLDCGRSNLAVVGERIEHDPGVAAKVLQMANSAWLGAGRSVVTAREAVTMLGSDAVLSTVVSAGIATLFEGLPHSIVDLVGGAGERSVRALARLRAEGMVPPALVGPALTAALVRDVGVLAMTLSPEGADEHEIRVALVDRFVPRLGCTVGELGAYLLTLWNLPDSVVAGVEYHDGAEPPCGPSVAAVVHVVAALADGRVGALDPEWLASVQLAGVNELMVA